MIQNVVLRKEKPTIIPLETNKGLMFRDSWVEACWLDAHRSGRIVHY